MNDNGAVLAQLDFDELTKGVDVTGVVDKNKFVTGNGVVLKLKKVNQSIPRDIVLKIPEPEMPKVFIEEKDRWEDNPNNPQYVAALRKYSRDTGLTTFYVYILYGTEVISVPDGIPEWNSNWHEDFAEWDITIRPVGSKSRYLDWLKYIVFENDTEIADCVTGIMRLSGIIGEEDVVETEATFQGNETRGTDTEPVPATED